MPNQAASVWLRRVSSHAGAFAQTAQQSIGGLFSSRKGASGVSGAEVATGAESAVKRQAADGWRAEGVRDPGVRQRGRYSRHDCEMFQEQVRLPCAASDELCRPFLCTAQLQSARWCAITVPARTLARVT